LTIVVRICELGVLQKWLDFLESTILLGALDPLSHTVVALVRVVFSVAAVL